MLDFDPIANIFPLIEGPARDEFRADLKARGLQQKISLRQGRVLDGRNRYLGLVANGDVDEADAAGDLLTYFPDWFEDFDQVHPGADPFDWVMSLNVHRRHMEPSQWAAVAANAETLKHGGARFAKSGGDQAGSGSGQPQQQDAKLQLDRTKLGEVLGVSPRLIASAAKVKREGAPELFKAVEQGRVKATVAEQLLTLPKSQQRDAVSALDTRKLPTLAKQTKRAETERRLGEKVRALPNRLYNVILADPPWRFEPYSRETGLDRAADNHYPTQDLGDIKGLPVGTLAAPDCVLFLWATSPMLPEALAVMRFWGFDYKSHIVWRKAASHKAGLVLGTGYWFRSAHEILLVGTKGDVPAPAPGTQWASIADAEPRKHSQKPDWAHEMIEAYFPNLNKIELNARAGRKGWDSWGNEAPDTDSGSLVGTGDASREETPGSAGSNHPEIPDGSPVSDAGGVSTSPARLPNSHSPQKGNGGADPGAAVPGLSAGREAGDSSPEAAGLPATYLAALAASTTPKGQHTRETATPILAAAYSIEPPVPLQRVADDLGHKKNTVLSWAHRAKLSDVERRSTNGAHENRVARSAMREGSGPSQPQVGGSPEC